MTNAYMQMRPVTPTQRHDTLLQMLGVNLGGWLVCEQWLTPNLWAGIRGPHWLPFGEFQLMMGARCCTKPVPLFIPMGAAFMPLLMILRNHCCEGQHMHFFVLS